METQSVASGTMLGFNSVKLPEKNAEMGQSEEDMHQVGQEVRSLSGDETEEVESEMYGETGVITDEVWKASHRSSMKTCHIRIPGT